MKLDKSKKYEFCGEVYEWVRDAFWCTDGRSFADTHFEFFADHGHVTEILEPLVFEGEVNFRDAGTFGRVTGCVLMSNIPVDDRKGKTFKVTWTEVVK